MSAFVSRRHSKQRPDSSSERGESDQRFQLPKHFSGSFGRSCRLIGTALNALQRRWFLRRFLCWASPSNGFFVLTIGALITVHWLPFFPVGESVQRYPTEISEPLLCIDTAENLPHNPLRSTAQQKLPSTVSPAVSPRGATPSRAAVSCLRIQCFKPNRLSTASFWLSSQRCPLRGALLPTCL